MLKPKELPIGFLNEVARTGGNVTKDLLKKHNVTEVDMAYARHHAGIASDDDKALIGGDPQNPPRIRLGIIVPENWDVLDWRERVKIAAKISGEKITKKEEADRIIRAYLEHGAAASAEVDPDLFDADAPANTPLAEKGRVTAEAEKVEEEEEDETE